MSLKIIYGRAGSGKTAKCFEIVDKILSGSEDKVIYLVPEHLSLTAEHTIASRYDFGKMSRVDVLSFERMAQYAFSKVGPVGVDYLDSTGKSIIMQSVFNDVSSKLIILKKAVQRTDFVKIMLNIIAELKSSGISPEMLKKAACEIADVNLKFKLSDIILIYEAYNNFLKFPFADSGDDMARLCEKIIKFNLFNDCHIIADGFTGFNQGQFNVLNLLMQNAKSFTVSLTANSLEPDYSDAFSRSTFVAKKLYELAYECKTEVLPNEYTGECKKYNDNKELLHLEQNYFKYPHSVYEQETENIKIIKARNYVTEVELAASEIIRLCREEGLRFRDFAIATRNSKDYYPLIKSVFDEYLIEYHIDEKLYVMKNSYTYSLLSPFDVVINKFKRESISNWIKSPLCGICDDTKYLLENYLYEYGCTYKMWQSDDDWTFTGDYSENELKTINESKNIVRKPLINFINSFSGRKTVSEIAMAFIKFLKETDAEKNTAELAKRLRKDGLITESEGIISVYNCIINTISEMVRLSGEKKITFDKFYSVLVSGLEGCDIGKIPLTVDSVEVTDVERIKRNNVKCLIVLGVSDGVFPKGYIKEGVLTTQDREILSGKCGVKLETVVDIHNQEDFVIYNALTSSDKYLYLSYPCADNEGKKATPSIIINRIKNIFPNVREISDVYTAVKKSIRFSEGVIPTFNKMLAGQFDYDTTLKQWFKNNRSDLYDIAVTADKYTNLPSALCKENVRLLYGDEMYSSVSKAEQYAKCGFAYFMRYGIRAKERRENTIQKNDAGTFLHAIIEEYSLFATEHGWNNIDKEFSFKKSAEITEKVLKAGLSSSYFESASNRYSIRKFTKAVSLALWNITEYYNESEFSPLGFEIGFGNGCEYPPIEITLDNGEKVYLTGKVDRADIWRTDDGNFISIVDYKSSKKNVELDQLVCGIQIQLPVYIDAICKSMKTKEPSAIPAAINYYHIYSPIIKGKNIDREELTEKIKEQLCMMGYTLDVDEVQSGIGNMYFAKSNASVKDFEKMIKTAYDKLSEILSEIRSGNININPTQNSSYDVCTYCPYKAVCNFDTCFEGNEYKERIKIDGKGFFADE